MLEALKLEIKSCAPEKRTKLLRFVSMTCSSAQFALEKPHLVVLSELAESLVDDIDRTTLVEAAEAFSRFDFASHGLILRFAWDEIDVAAPVLQHSTVLTDDDLVDIIRRRGDTHSEFIALRTSLPALVTDCLINYADMKPLFNLIENPGATFSKDGYKELATIGSINEQFGEALCIRADTPAELADPLIESLENDEFQSAFSDEKRKRKPLNNQIKHARLLRQERREYLPRTRACLDQITNGTKTFNDCIIELCEEDARQEIYQLFAAQKSCSEAEIMTNLKRIGGMQFITLCRELDMSLPAFEAIAKLRAQAAKNPTAQFKNMMRQFQSMMTISRSATAA